MYTVVQPTSSDLRQVRGGAESLSGIPIIISEEGSLATVATDYLIELSLGSWSGMSGTRLSRNSIDAISRDLVSFLNYCEAFGASWQSMERGDENNPLSVLGYANAMDTGAWASRRAPISAKTIARRLNVVQDLLRYAGAKGHRTPYAVNPIRGYGSRVWSDRKRILLPKVEEVTGWLDRVSAAGSRKNYLMARLPFETGLRRQEILSFPADGMPTVEQTQKSEYVYLAISYGAKGGRSRLDDTLNGKPRTIRMKSTFALRLMAFKSGRSQRLADISEMRRHNDKYSVPKELFFNPRSGRLYSVGHLNDLFSRYEPPNVPGWSPHIARHVYACWLLVDLIRASMSQTGLAQAVTYEKFGALAHRSVEAVQSFLGHEQQDTTERYLRWAYAHMVETGLFE